MNAVFGPLYDPIVESDRDRECDDPNLGTLIGGSAGGTGGKWAASERDVVDWHFREYGCPNGESIDFVSWEKRVVPSIAEGGKEIMKEDLHHLALLSIKTRIKPSLDQNWVRVAS